MDKENTKKIKASNRALIIAVSLLLVLLIALASGGIYARFTASDDTGDEARVAYAGVDLLQLCEKEVEQVASGEIASVGALYKFTGKKAVVESKEDKTYSFEYENVIPGVDIPYAPFIEMEIDSEVSYQLCLKITDTIPTRKDSEGKEIEDAEGNPIKTVVYEVLTDLWTYNEDKGVYTYNTYFEAGKAQELKFDSSIEEDEDQNVIWIIKNNKLYVSEHYNYDSFSIKFEIYLQQAQ